MRIPSGRTVAFAVGRVTFTEIISQRVLYNVILCAALMFGASFLASRLTFIRPDRIILDFGISALNLSCSALAILVGSGLLGREYERRTVHVALSHPITKPQFVVGKFMGLSAVLTLNWLLLCAAYCIMLGVLEGFGYLFQNSAFFPALFLILIQSLVIASVSVFLSTFSTVALAVMLSIGIYLVGQDISELRTIIHQIQSPALQHLLEVLVTIPPDFEYFNYGLRLAYGISAGMKLFTMSIAYGMFLILLFLFASGLAIRYKEV